MVRKTETDGQRQLLPEDRILWETVARTARPLHGRIRPPVVEADEFHRAMQSPVKPAISKSKIEQTAEPQKRKPQSPALLHQSELDRPTHRKIAKGRIDIEARIDLHGLTQGDAYEMLYGFLADAHARGLRHVMIITGKGRSLGSDGALKQAVPHWFSTPLFRLLVSAFEDAARHHGGQGALYVRLRRREQISKALWEHRK